MSLDAWGGLGCNACEPNMPLSGMLWCTGNCSCSRMQNVMRAEGLKIPSKHHRSPNRAFVPRKERQPCLSRSLIHSVGFVDCAGTGVEKECYLVDPASSHMLVSKIKPCMCKYELIQTVKLRMAH